MLIKYVQRDSPGGAVNKNLPSNAGDLGSILGQGRPHTPLGKEAGAPQLLSLHSRAHEQQPPSLHSATHKPAHSRVHKSQPLSLCAVTTELGMP